MFFIKKGLKSAPQPMEPLSFTEGALTHFKLIKKYAVKHQNWKYSDLRKSATKYQIVVLMEPSQLQRVLQRQAEKKDTN